METRPDDPPRHAHLARGVGVILGKFMPPHRGHRYLVEFGQRYCARLHVLVCSLEGDPIAGALRYRWMQEMFPSPEVRLVHITEDLPQQPDDHPDFWRIWNRVVRDAVGEPIDYVFASEDYGLRLAEVLGGVYVPVDEARELITVSGTQIRADPLRHWEMLPRPVRGHYLRRVCLFGPESTGKSTLARALAERYETVYVHEYARPYLNPRGGVCTRADIPVIVRGQVAAEDALALDANRLLFCDTDPLTTVIWSETLFGECPGWIRELARGRRYDLTLLLDVDVPWVDDQQRFLGGDAQRSAFFTNCRDVLDAHRRPYRVIRGDWAQRFAAACDAVDESLQAREAG